MAYFFSLSFTRTVEEEFGKSIHYRADFWFELAGLLSRHGAQGVSWVVCWLARKSKSMYIH